VTPRWRSYVAIGDSFTEGLWDPYGDDLEDLAGWADRLAATLSQRRLAAGEAPLEYANLAIRGRRLRRIIDEQLPTAVAMSPDLISIVGGGIDVLRLGADADRLAAQLERAVIRARATGADVLLATCMDTRNAGVLLGVTRPRMALYSAHIATIAHRHGCFLLDQWGLHALDDPRMWSTDRIHLSPEGHHRISQAALVGLGLEPDDAAWRARLPAADAGGHVQRLRNRGTWLRRDVAPWVGRGIRQVSTGDDRMAKRPALTPVAPRTPAAGAPAGPTPPTPRGSHP